MKKFVYADNAATSQMDEDVFEIMKPYLLTEYGNASQSYSFSRKSRMALKEARNIIASCINSNPNEIYFTSGGTESDNWAIKGIMCPHENKDTVITSKIEHKAILGSIESLDENKISSLTLDVTEKGLIEPEILKNAISLNTKLVSIMLANNEIGTIQPIKELSALAHTYGALFHTDAVQAIGHIPVDVKELGVDLLSASAHKFNGPKGIGFLYIRDGIKIPPYLDGGHQENSMRAGTENVPAIIGMAYALKNNCKQIKSNIAHLTKLENILLNRLKGNLKIDFIKNGNENSLPGLLSLSFQNANGEVLLHRLDLRGISVSTGSACDSENSKVSHVLTAIGLDEKYAKGTIRISFGKYNTVDDAIYIATEIEKIFAL